MCVCVCVCVYVSKRVVEIVRFRRSRAEIPGRRRNGLVSLMKQASRFQEQIAAVDEVRAAMELPRRPLHMPKLTNLETNLTALSLPLLSTRAHLQVCVCVFQVCLQRIGEKVGKFRGWIAAS